MFSSNTPVLSAKKKALDCESVSSNAFFISKTLNQEANTKANQQTE